jgi:ABC-2 type transport system permease protein
VSQVTTVRLIAAREVRQRLRSRLFVGTTLVISALLTVLAALPAVLGVFDPDQALLDRDEEEAALPRLGVVGALSSAERSAIEAALGPIEVVEVADVDAASAALLTASDDLTAVVVPGERVLVAPSGQLLRPASVLATRVAEALALGELFGDDPDRVGEVLARPSLPVDEVGDVDPAEATARLVVANLGVVFLFAVLIMYASMIINGVIEEKGSRVVELLVAAVPVRWLMTGKLLGLGVVGLLQTVTLFAPPLVVLLLTAGERSPPVSVGWVSPSPGGSWPATPSTR